MVVHSEHRRWRKWRLRVPHRNSCSILFVYTTECHSRTAHMLYASRRCTASRKLLVHSQAVVLDKCSCTVQGREEKQAPTACTSGARRARSRRRVRSPRSPPALAALLSIWRHRPHVMMTSWWRKAPTARGRATAGDAEMFIYSTASSQQQQQQ